MIEGKGIGEKGTAEYMSRGQRYSISAGRRNGGKGLPQGDTDGGEKPRRIGHRWGQRASGIWDLRYKRGMCGMPRIYIRHVESGMK